MPTRTVHDAHMPTCSRTPLAAGDDVLRGLRGKGAFVALLADSTRTSTRVAGGCELLVMELRVRNSESPADDTVTGKLWSSHKQFQQVCQAAAQGMVMLKVCNVSASEQRGRDGHTVYNVQDAAWLDFDLLPEEGLELLSIMQREQQLVMQLEAGIACQLVAADGSITQAECSGCGSSTELTRVGPNAYECTCSGPGVTAEVHHNIHIPVEVVPDAFAGRSIANLFVCSVSVAEAAWGPPPQTLAAVLEYGWIASTPPDRAAVRAWLSRVSFHGVASVELGGSTIIAFVADGNGAHGVAAGSDRACDHQATDSYGTHGMAGGAGGHAAASVPAADIKAFGAGQHAHATMGGTGVAGSAASAISAGGQGCVGGHDFEFDDDIHAMDADADT